MTSGRLRVLALMLADALCLLVIGLGTAACYKALGFGDYSLDIYYHLWPMIPLFLGVNVVCRLYHGNVMYPAMPLSPVEEFRRLVASALFSHLLLMSFLGFTRHNLDYSRLVIAVSGVLTGLFAQSVRNVVRALLFKLGWGQIRVALAGDGRRASRIVDILQSNAYIGFKVVLTFTDDQAREIIPTSRRHDVKILLACQDERLFHVQMRDFSAWFNYIEYLPELDVFPVFGSHAVVFDGLGGLEMMNQGRMKALRWEKTALDYALSVCAFVLALPFFIVIPLLIKLTSRGPVFYRAERLGRHGRPFRIWKFRSMYADADARLKVLLAADPAARAEWNAHFKLNHDPRVTPIGRLLRKSSLDELPQLFNVFAREMSLIGPRPIVADERHYYGRDYDVFSRVRPGVTGLWQCSGRSDTTYTRRVALDVYYILNWSLWMDVWIVVRTFFSILTMKGAC